MTNNFSCDSRRFQFFKTIRSGNHNSPSFTHQQSSVFQYLDGWRILLAFLLKEPAYFGYEDYRIDGVDYEALLGKSETKHVFSTSGFKGGLDHSGVTIREVIVKVFKREEARSIEARNLKRLASLPESFLLDMVPHLLTDAITTRNQLFAMITFPRCAPVQPHNSYDGLKGERVYGEDIEDLINLLQVVHQDLRMIHRDIKPANIFKFRNKIFLHDWGSACDSGAKVRFEGTKGFAVFPEDGNEHIPLPHHDLNALAKSAYLMLFNEKYSSGEMETVSFWESRFKPGSLWEEIWKVSCEAIDMRDKERQDTRYAKLREMYRKLK